MRLGEAQFGARHFRRQHCASRAHRTLAALSRAQASRQLLAERLVVIDPGFGIESALAHGLLGRSFSRAADHRPPRGSGRSQHEVSQLVDTLGVRLGESNVFRLAPVESALPERAVRRVPALHPTEGLAWPRAFDLIELDGEDLRWAKLEDRKHALADLLRGTDDGIAYNKHFDGDGEIIFRHACALGCEGIVSKRLGSAYRSGRVNHWLKVKNPAAPAARREAEEDWNGKRFLNSRSY